MDRLARRLVFIALAIAVVLVIGTIGFAVVDKYPLFDAFYMTVITMTTVGYSEIRGLSRAGRIFNVFVILFGVSVMFFAIGSMTQTIIEMQLGDLFGKRRVKRMIDKLKNHYIVCGFGRVGRGAANELKRGGASFVIVDRNPERVEQAMRLGMLAVQADSTRDETLREIGVDRARGLIAALGSDADNLFVILSAKTLNPMLSVATRAAEEDAEQKLRRAGADAVFTPYTITGHHLVQALLRPHVFQFVDFTTKNIGLDVTMEQVKVGEHSEAANKSIRDLQLRRETGVIVLAIRKADGRMLFNPPADAELCEGDYLVVMGEPHNLHKLEALIAGAGRVR
jgi:voltage-gated potassium channel